MAIITKKKLILKEADSQTNSYIVIHNSDHKNTNKTYEEYEKAAASKSTKDAYTHYIVDDYIIIQCLKDNWPGSHTAGEKPYKGWGAKGIKDGTVNNSNSIGITVVDAASVDLTRSTDNLIELIRWIMKNYNIPLDHVVRHGDTAYRKCPATIVDNKKWDYIKKEIKTRNDKQQKIKIDFKDFETADNMKQDGDSSSSENSTTDTSGSSGSGQVIQLVFHEGTVQESLSNANTSDNWVDMHRIKGITLHMYPPYHNCDVKEMVDRFKYYKWDRTFHYKVDHDTKIDFNKKPTSGKTRGGNDVGTSRPDVDLVQGEGLYSGVIIGGYGGGGDATSSTDDSTTIQPSGEVFGWPLPKLTRISSPFGPRICPYHGKEMHYGIDIPANAGTDIHAYANGKVTKSEFHNSYGNYIIIDHGSGCSTKYAHQSKRLKEVGDTVNAGDVIGKVGTTGSSTGNHLHFELHLDNKAIDPAQYVKPGGGSKKIPDIFNKTTSANYMITTFAANDENNEIEAYDLNNPEDYIVYDNVDKGTICFASENNGQHTYIERALFNNQHPKYTLSIGEFFDNQETALEKDANYDYPKTEKKLIEQCAKALYDEGFSSNELWREFDLNRAPSPFLYLDREKWILFLEEVQKQIDWLNDKYGKVTAKYVPNNLLKNENTNEFIDISPDLGVNPGTGGSGTTGGNTGSTGQKIDSLQGTTMIGDSRTVAMRDEFKLLSGIDVYAHIGANASYFYNKKKKVNRLSGIKNSTKAIIVWLGTNYPEGNIEHMKNMLDYLKSTYSSIPLYVIKESYVAKGSEAAVGRSASVQNKHIDKWNSEISSYCSSKSINFIDFTSDLNDGKYGKKDLMQDGVHYNKKGYTIYLDDLTKNITTGGSSSSSDTKANDISNEFKPVVDYDNDIETYAKDKDNDKDKDDNKKPETSEDITADKDNKGKIAYVDHDTNVYIYANADTASKKIRALTTGEELTIIGAKDKFYQVKIDADKGYVRAKNLSIVMSNKYGNANSDNIGKKCWTKFEDTIVYKTKELKKKVTTLEDQARGKILDADKDLYYIKFTKLEKKEDTGDGGDSGDGSDAKDNSTKKDNKKKDTNKKKKKTITPETQYIDYEGWVKAYRITTDWNYFDYEKTETVENPYDSTEIEILNGDFEGNKSSTDNESSGDNNTEEGGDTGKDDKDKDKDKDKDNKKISTHAKDDTTKDDNKKDDKKDTDDASSGSDIANIGWSKYGDFDYNIIDNPKWDEDGHWNYRKDHFARIRSAVKATTGLTNDITIAKVEQNGKELDYYVRFSAWIKQVTQDDIPNGIEVDSVDTLMKNGITFALLDKNNKIKFSQKLEIPKDTKKFGQVSCVFSGVPEGDYKLFIGSKNKYDIFLDNVSGEQIYNIDPDEEDEITSGNIGISGVGTTSKDNGGIMAYSVGKAKNPNAKQPEIKTIITTEEYENIMKNADSKLIPFYLENFEPYDKGLDSVLAAPVMQDDRLNTLTETMQSFTGNDIHYNVVETGPGSTDHCVKPADELNVLYKQVSVKCDPIYPDLIVPPNYSTSDYDNKTSDSTIPLQALQSGEMSNENLGNRKLTYDYDVLKDKKKESKGKPINYNDAYPYDSKITELEKHYPKVSIDEIESRLYSCNHPGCPIAHPMAKNFAMLSDMQLAQSKKTEQRLARIENISSVILRNLGRLGSRMNINCVYYGGQDIFGKYRSIRCTHDDRIHDGCSVTIDQCLCCTRYEPIIGQIYDILDETGINGSALLDDMQMSYMTLDDLRNLNQVERRSSGFDYADVSIDEKQTLPKSLIDTWKELDKKKFEESLKDKYSTEKERKEAQENAKESDYVFQMDWTETELDGQAPDVKKYPSEGLTMKYYRKNGDSAEKVETTYNLDTKLNKDVIEDIKNNDSIANGEWVDTREEADTTQSNKYTSEDFYFENFNKNRTGYEYDNGLAGYIGLTTSGSVGSGLTGAECRNKIVEKAKEIVQLHKDGKAFYSNSWRTVDDTKRQTIASGPGKGMYGYDCSSMASCCYKYAGLTSLYNKNCAGGTVMSEIVNNGGEMWLCNDAGLSKAMPGDCIVCCGTSYNNKFKPTEDDMKNRKKLTIYHIMIYIGNNQVAHASTPKAAPNGIRIDNFGPKHYAWNNSFFIRPKDLIEADKAASSTVGGISGDGITETTGTIDGHNYVCILERCVCTNYCKYGDSTNGGGPFNVWNKGGSSGMGVVDGCTVAAHNMPYGTKLYIPAIKQHCKSSDGTWIVTDTGGPGFDFDVFTNYKVTDGSIKAWDGLTGKAYVVSWGNGKGIAPSFKTSDKKTGGKWASNLRAYRKLGGCTINLTKWRKDDIDFK
jgi:murein DD-endopeptidase MepM/ murein hydrolase activator NlpD